MFWNVSDDSIYTDGQYNLSFPKTYFQTADLYKNLVSLIENI